MAFSFQNSTMNPLEEEGKVLQMSVCVIGCCIISYSYTEVVVCVTVAYVICLYLFRSLNGFFFFF